MGLGKFTTENSMRSFYRETIFWVSSFVSSVQIPGIGHWVCFHVIFLFPVVFQLGLSVNGGTPIAGWFIREKTNLKFG